MPKRKTTKAVKFSLLPITAAKRERLGLVADNFQEIYNAAAVRLPSLQQTSKFKSRIALNRLRIELHDITRVSSQIAQEAIESARANYVTMETRKDALRTTMEALEPTLAAYKLEHPDRKRTIAKMERRLRRSRRALRTKYPTLTRKIIRIHNQAWKFVETNGRIYVVVPAEKVGNRFQKIWLPIKDSEHYRYLINTVQKWGVGQLDLATNTFITSMTTTIEVEDYVPETFIGIALGSDNLATMAVVRGGKVQKVRMWDGHEIDHIRARFRDYRSRMQKANRLDLVKANRGREERWMRHINHVTSYHIARIAAKYPHSFIAFEELHQPTDGLRWNSYQLRQMIEYKIAAHGGRHITLYASRKIRTATMCSECGHADWDNRDGAAFKCLKCGYAVHASVNTAKNLARRGEEVLEKAKKKKTEAALHLKYQSNPTLRSSVRL